MPRPYRHPRPRAVEIDEIEGPTPEFAQHHPVTTRAISPNDPRQAWRRDRTLDRMLTAGEIDDAAYSAICSLHDDIDAGHGVSDNAGENVQVDCARNYLSDGWTDYRLDALDRVALIKRVLGRQGYGFVEAGLVRDFSYHQIGKALDMSPKTVKARCIRAASDVARVYAAIRKHGLPGARVKLLGRH